MKKKSSSIILDQIANFIRGVSFPKELGKMNPSNGSVLLLRSNNIDDGLNLEKPLFIPSELVKDTQYIKSNDILICMNSGSRHLVGKVVQIENNQIADPLSFGSFCGVLRCHESVNPKYIGFFFRSKAYKNYIQNKTSGVLINNLKASDITDISISLPPLLEQQCIAETLEDIDKLHQKQRKALKLTRQMIQALFYEMFGDFRLNTKDFDTAKIQDVAQINPRDEVNLKETDEVTFVPMSAIDTENATIQEPETKLFRETKKKGFSSFKNGDVLFAKITPCMQNKKSAIASQLTNGVGYGSTEFFILRPSKNILAEYLLQILRLPEVIEAAKNQFTGTAGQQRVPLDFISNYPIILPPISLQNEYKQKIQEINLLLIQQTDSLEKLAALFEATLNQVFLLEAE